MDFADGLLLAKRGQKPTSVLFFAGSGECRRVNCLGAVQEAAFSKQQHHAAYQYTPQEYAESLADT